jgi:WD40 repeat protein
MPELAVNASLVFSPDADRLAEVADGRVITIWDVHTGKKLVAFPESGNSIMGIAFSPDGTRLVSVSSEGEVWLWDAELGKALIPLRASSGPYAVSEVSVIAEKYAPQPLAPIDALVGRSASGPMEPSISFSANGRKITLTTVVPNPTGAIVRIETWDGSPRQK